MWLSCFVPSDLNPEQWEQLWLPLWPLASDNLRNGIFRTSRSKALGLRYIEANPQAISNLLIVDIDHSDASLRAVWGSGAALPNAVVENPLNGHAHAIWALAEPFTRTEYARRKPLAFAAAVTEGLRRRVDGDKGYSGLITKNPEHQDWRAEWWTDHLYSLGEIADALGDHMPAPGWKRTRRLAPVGLGRNCAIFEQARTFAYPAARRIRLLSEYPRPEDYRRLQVTISTEVDLLNAEYFEPLWPSETRAISQSIYRWITTKFTGWIDSRTVNAATFTAIQSARGKKAVRSKTHVNNRRKEQLQARLADAERML